jgi:hypothetical protein
MNVQAMTRTAARQGWIRDFYFPAADGARIKQNPVAENLDV